MPKGGIKGNKGNCTPKVRSSDMGILLATQKELALANPDSPPVNKRSLKRLENDDEKRGELTRIASRYAEIVAKELGTYNKNVVKNEVAVDLDDYPAVMERTVQYFNGCAEMGVPATLGSYYCIAFGLSSQRVNAYLRTHQNKSTEFILKMKDAIASSLTEASLVRIVDNVTTIFELKNKHGYADNVRIEAAMPEQLPEINEDDLKAEYMKIINDTDSDNE